MHRSHLQTLKHLRHRGITQCLQGTAAGCQPAATEQTRSLQCCSRLCTRSLAFPDVPTISGIACLADGAFAERMAAVWQCGKGRPLAGQLRRGALEAAAGVSGAVPLHGLLTRRCGPFRQVHREDVPVDLVLRVFSCCLTLLCLQYDMMLQLPFHQGCCVALADLQRASCPHKIERNPLERNSRVRSGESCNERDGHQMRGNDAPFGLQVVELRGTSAQLVGE